MDFIFEQKKFEVRFAFFILFFLFGATHCAPVQHKKHVDIAAATLPLVQIWTYEAAAHGRNFHIDDLVLEFGRTSPDAIGQCFRQAGATSVVLISADYWKYASGPEKEIVVFHELGHCLLNYDHMNAVDSNGMPASIMNWQMFSGAYYNSNREQYLTQYFGHVRLY